jgi:hypothetical protein
VVAEQRRRLALLVLLASGRERGVSRDKLIAALSPESPSDSARRLLPAGESDRTHATQTQQAMKPARTRRRGWAVLQWPQARLAVCQPGEPSRFRVLHHLEAAFAVGQGG